MSGIVVLVVLYMVAMIAIGLVTSRYVKVTSDFLVAGRKLNLLLTSATLAAVQIGAGIVLGGSSTAAELGVWPGMWYGIGCGGGLIVAGLLAARKMRQSGGYVPLDFFADRYGDHKWVRLWAWLSNVPSLFGIFVAQMLATGWVFSAFGLERKTAIVAAALVTMAYSALGGMWGVVLTDVVQVGVMLLGIPLLAVASLLALSARGGDVAQIFSTPFIPPGTGTRAIFTIVPFLIAISVSYDAFMRYQSAESDRVASWGCVIGGIITIVVSFLCALVGAAGKLLFPEVEAGSIFPHTALNILNPWLSGLVVSAVAAAAMSSANCLLISLGATFSRDLYNKVLRPEADLDELKYSKLISTATVVVAGLASIYFAFRLTNIIDTIIIFNYPYMGSMVVPLLGGVLWDKGTRQGAYAAMIVGGLIGVGSFFAGIPGPLQGWVNPDLGLLVAYSVSAVVYVVVSLATQRRQAQEAV